MSIGLHARRATGLTGAEREESFTAVSIGLHGRLATGLTGAKREEISTRTESVARRSREGRAAHEAERSPAVSFFFFS